VFTPPSVDITLPGDWNGNGTFPFFGNAKSVLRVEPHGYIGLSTQRAPVFCDPLFVDPELIPCYDRNPIIITGFDYNDLIAFMWSDDFNPGTADDIRSYWVVTGESPNRILAIAFFGPTLMGGQPAAVQVHLHETSNVIEVHTEQQPGTSTVTRGVEGPLPPAPPYQPGAVQAAVLPGENRAMFALAESAVRFHTDLDTPDGIGDACDNVESTNNGAGCGYGVCS